MAKIYIVKHEYDVDGGFGDAVSAEEVVAIFDNKDDADAFAIKFSNRRIYDRPYADLYYGGLTVNEENIIGHDEFPFYMESLDKENLPWESWFKNQEKWFKELYEKRQES